VSNVLLGLPGRNQQINLQTLSPKIDAKFSLSDVSWVQETPFDMFCKVEKLGIFWWLNRLIRIL
jgi:hypothetical protein